MEFVEGDRPYKEVSKRDIPGEDETEFSTFNDTYTGSFIESETPTKPHRQKWNTRLDFLISLIGSAVGLGNIWRFPYICYRNGGAFLIPYLLCVAFIAFPLLLLDISIGQLFSCGGIGIWDWCPAFRGIGYFNLSYLLLGNVIYSIVIAWSLYYAVMSFSDPLPWGSCNNTWNTANCTTLLNDSTGVSSSSEFWEHHALGLTNGINEIGQLQWPLSLCVLFIWLCMFLSLFRGINLTGKVMYPVVIVPYIILFVLLGYSASMPGSMHGVYFLFRLDLDPLKQPQVWADAGMQAYLSLVGVGNVAIALGSYNSYNKRSYFESASTTFVNSFTSIIAGFVVFMALGSTSIQTGVPIDRVAGSGPGLAFVTYPLILLRAPLPQFWSVLFFLMMVGLGFSSLIVGMEGVACMTGDIIPKIATEKSKHRLLFMVVLCSSGGLAAVLLTFGNGMYISHFLEFYNGTRFIFFGTLMQVLALLFFSNRWRRLLSAISRMYKLNIKFLLFAVWGFVVPPILALLLYCSIRAYTTLYFRRGTTGEIYYYPSLSVGMGWVLSLSQAALIPLYVLYSLIRAKGSNLRKRWQYVTKPRLNTVQRQRLGYEGHWNNS